MSDDAATWLADFTKNSLVQMAKAQGVTARGNSRADYEAALVRTLFQQERVTRAVAALQPNERAALDQILLAGGSIASDVLRSQLEEAGHIDPPKDRRSQYATYGYGRESGTPSRPGSRNFADVVARLAALGLVLWRRDLGGWSNTQNNLGEPGRRLSVPEPLLAGLPRPELPIETVAAPPEVNAADPSPLLRDLYVLLSLARQEPLPLTQRGQIMKRTLVRLDAALRVGEDAGAVRSEDELTRIPFLRALAVGAGLLRQAASSLLPTDRVGPLLEEPPGARLARLFAVYRDTPSWCEVFAIPRLNATGSAATIRYAPPEIVAARRRILAEIGRFPAGEWIAIAHLIDRVRRTNYEFLFPRWTGHETYYGYGPPNPYLGHNSLQVRFDVAHTSPRAWEIVEGGFIRVILTRVLHWLGLIDLGGPAEAPVAFRVTDLGHRILRGEAVEVETPPTNVVIQPNFHAIVFDPAGEDVLWRLDEIADRIKSDQVTEYSLTRESIYRAQQAGHEAASILAFLDQVCSVPIPANIRRSIEEWAASHDRIVIRRGPGLIRTNEPADLDAILADADLAPLVGRRLTPTVAVVESRHLVDLAHRLSHRSYLPSLIEGQAPSSGPHLSIDGEGRITFAQPLPDLWLRAAIDRFVDWDAAGGPRLTPESLRRAVRSGLDANAILAALEPIHRGPIAADAAAWIRRWAKDWGSGAIVEATLLQVENAAILADLLADPEVGRYLRPVPRAEGLAIVGQADVRRVRQALKERGLDLADSLRP